MTARLKPTRDDNSKENYDKDEAESMGEKLQPLHIHNITISLHIKIHANFCTDN